MAGLVLSGLCAACSTTGIGMGSVGVSATVMAGQAGTASVARASVQAAAPGREGIYAQSAARALQGNLASASPAGFAPLNLATPALTTRDALIAAPVLAASEATGWRPDTLRDDRSAVLALNRPSAAMSIRAVNEGFVAASPTAPGSTLQVLSVAPQTGRDALVQSLVDANVRPWLSDERRFGGEVTLAAPLSARSGLGVSVTPRAQFVEGFGNASTRAGAELRLGENVFKGDGPETGWYLFAAADGEAITWDWDGQGLRLGDRVSVGDMQAGISTAMAGGQLSFSYVRREFSYEDREATEDGAAISFTLRR